MCNYQPSASLNLDEIRSDSWNQAAHAFGTAAIFQERARKLKSKLRALTFLGIVIPVLVGGVAMSFGTEGEWFKWLLYAAAGLGLIQLIGSVWSLVSGWEETHAYALASAVANDSLATAFSDFAKNPPANSKDTELRYEVLKTENNLRRHIDNQQNVTEKEKRFGMRAALRQYQKQCSACKKVPTTMKPTSCGVCGNF